MVFPTLPIQIIRGRCLFLGKPFQMKRLMPAALVLVLAGCTDQPPTPADFLGASPAPKVLTNLPSQVRAFIEQKAAQVPVLAAKLAVTPDRATLDYFALARKGQYRAASKIEAYPPAALPAATAPNIAEPRAGVCLESSER